MFNRCRWFVGGEEQPEATNTLTYDSISADLNDKVVKCQATNAHGTGEKEMTLNVYCK